MGDYAKDRALALSVLCNNSVLFERDVDSSTRLKSAGSGLP